MWSETFIEVRSLLRVNSKKNKKNLVVEKSVVPQINAINSAVI